MKTVVSKTLKKELRQNLLWDLDANNDNYSLWMSKGGSKLHKILNAKYKNIHYPDLIYDLPFCQNVT